MTQVIDLGKLRFYFAGQWSNSTVYEQNDVVKYGGNVYVYSYSLKTSSYPPTNTTYWRLMLEGLSFDGVWDSATAYNIGDGVAYGGKVYISLQQGTNKAPDNASNSAYWSTFVEGIQWESNWTNSINYQVNDVVKHGGSVYISKQNSTGQDPTNTVYWDKFVEGISAQGVYNNSTAYIKDQTVAYGANIYRAIQNTTGNLPTVASHWEIYVGGTQFRNSFDSAATYFPNDLVGYGGAVYRSRVSQAAVNPTDSDGWAKVLEGFSYRNDYAAGTKYFIGDTVTYGGSLFKALSNAMTGVLPSVTASWQKVVPGFKFRNDWQTSTAYGLDEVVTHGGNSYISTVPHASTNFDSNLSSSYWTKFNSGLKFRGTYGGVGTLYAPDDLVTTATAVYRVKITFTSTGNFATDLAFNSGANMELFVAGGANSLPTIGSGSVGKMISVKQDASGYDLSYPDDDVNSFYVSSDSAIGKDDSNYGTSANAPFRTIKFASIYIHANKTADSSAVIHLGQGEFVEKLPVSIPHNTAILGTGLRNTRISPKPGFDSADAMFYVRDGNLIEGITMSGMGGFTADSAGGDPADIEKASVGGVFFRLDPSYPIVNKSPYIKDCSAFSTGGIGAIVDAGHWDAAKAAASSSVVSIGSMVFHAFTNIHSDGVGFWIRNNGKAEIVSCFTYYCKFGYASSAGGQIRALNGNNSYGTYGSISVGFDSDETSVNGKVRGFNVDYKDGTLSGEFEAGDVIVQPDKKKKASNISRSTVMQVTMATPHLMSTKDRIRFDSAGVSQWDSDITSTLAGVRSNITRHIQKVDSFSFNVYNDSGFGAGFNSSEFGAKSTTSAAITDITRSNPIAVTVSSHALDSYNLVQIKSVIGMTQVNNQFYVVDSHDANILKLKEADNQYLTITGDSSGYDVAGTTQGSSVSITGTGAVGGHGAINLWKGSRYYFVFDSALGVKHNPYLSTTDSAAWGLNTFGGEYLTNVRNSRSKNGLKVTFDSAAPDTLYLNSARVKMPITLNLTSPSRINATGYSAYSTGGQISFTDSGWDFDSASFSKLGTRATVINSQTAINRLIVGNQIDGSGFTYGDSIQESGGVAQAILKDSSATHGQIGYVMTFDGFTVQPKEGGSVSFVTDSGLTTDSGYDSNSYVIQSTSEWDSATGQITLAFSTIKDTLRPAFHAQAVRVRYRYSQTRLTGHDFLSIGTGNKTLTNYPGTPLQGSAQGNETIEKNTGRVYFVSTDQDGNFRVGKYFRIDQATGRATLDASAFDLAGLTSLRLGSIGAKLGEQINEFSSDGTLAGGSNKAVPTEGAVKTYVDTQIANNASITLPKTAKTGEIAFEKYIGFESHEMGSTHNRTTERHSQPAGSVKIAKKDF
mgnify:FL=1